MVSLKLQTQEFGCGLKASPDCHALSTFMRLCGAGGAAVNVQNTSGDSPHGGGKKQRCQESRAERWEVFGSRSMLVTRETSLWLECQILAL